jgi:general secretion pathway protein C
VGLGAGKGVALLAIDGKPAKAFRIGSTVDAGWVLQSVQPRSVALGPEVGGPARLLLELPRRSAQE